MDFELMWLCALIVFIVVEAVSVQLVAIWFALGSLGSLIAAFCGADIIVQLVVFVAVSLVTLLASRPLVKKFMSKRVQKTNFDRIISMTGVVTEQISNLDGAGYVAVDGKQWMARTETDGIIAVGEKVKILRIEGAKVIVEKEKNND